MSVTKRIIIPAFIFLLVFSIVSRVFFRDFQNGWEAYQNKDYKTAYEIWLPLAEKGDTRAQFFMGFMHDMGFGVPENDKEAVKWYRLVAEQGDSRAQLFLGFMYDLGKGTPENDKEAIKWYRLAAEQGSHEAAEHLSKLEKKKIPKELEGLFADANKGIAKAQYNLAMKYANKEGGFRNEKEAAKWFELAAKQGFKAKKNIYELAKNNVSKALEILKSDAEKGIPEARYTLSVMYGNGEGVPQDIKKSIMWCQLAAEQGYAIAQFNLAVLYSTGQGVPEDKQKALKWYKTAAETKIHTKKIVKTSFRKKNIPQVLKRVVYNAEKGAVDAQINLALMYASGEIVPEDTNKALKWFQRSLKLKIESEKNKYLQNGD